MPPCVLVQMLLLRKVPKQFRLAILIKFENDRLATGFDLMSDAVAHLASSPATSPSREDDRHHARQHC